MLICYNGAPLPAAPNPPASPTCLTHPESTVATKSDTFVEKELQGILEPGETVQYTGYLVKQPGLFWQFILAGGLLLFLMTKAYYVAVTNKRMVIIQTKLGLFGPGVVNKGVETISLADIKKIKVGGMLNNRSLDLDLGETKRTFRCAPWFKGISGQKAFFEGFPKMINERQITA